MDIKTEEQRSYNMSRIRSKNTKPEITMFNLLKSAKIPFKKHFDIYGKPDIVIPQQKIAIFINGEFWHGKKFNSFKNSVSAFWKDKIGKKYCQGQKGSAKVTS